jgi:hypothetical protein
MSAARSHRCKWPGCPLKVPGWKWGCGEHFAALPAGIRDRLVGSRRWWPEWTAAANDGIRFARAKIAEERKAVRDREAQTAARCRVCGGPPSPRLVRYCVQCHIAEFTGDRS